MKQVKGTGVAGGSVLDGKVTEGLSEELVERAYGTFGNVTCKRT